MVVRAVLAALVAAFLCSPVFCQQPDLRIVAPQLGNSDETRLLQSVRSAHSRNAVVHVGTRGACSGFFLDRTRVLTAGHCTSGDPVIINGEPATLVKRGYKVDPKDGVDLALYSVEKGSRVSRLSLNLEPSPIEQVFLVATIGSRVGLIQFGRLSFNSQKFLDIDMQGGPGASGGGVYSYDGRLVCVMVSGFYMGNEKESFLIASTCVPAKRVRDFIETN